MKVAIDGPAGAGKSTIARKVAKQLGFIYVDTGMLYRAVGLTVLRHGVSLQDADGIVRLLPEISIALIFQDGEQRTMLGDEDVTEKLWTPEVSMAASTVSALPQVRKFLLDLQRGLAEEQSVIMDGRDIGTVVLPDAQVKIFLTASAGERAKRRYEELLQKGEQVSYEEVLEQLMQRDQQDSIRKEAPLKQAQDAYFLDTSKIGLEESVEAVIQLIEQNRKVGKEL